MEMQVTLKSSGEVPELQGYEWFAEHIEDDGSSYGGVHIFGCVAKEYALSEAAEYFDNGGGNGMKEMTIRIRGWRDIEPTKHKLIAEYQKEWNEVE